MALLYIDGFDNWNTTPFRGWSTVLAGTGSVQFITGRVAGNAIQIVAGNGGGIKAFRNLSTNYTTLIAGFGWRPDGLSSGQALFVYQDGGAEQLSLRIDATNRLFISRNGTTLATETNPAATLSHWDFLEFRVTFSATVGAWSVRRNGAVITGLPDTSSVNTITTANAFANQISLGQTGTPTNQSQTIDDLYLCDTTGSVNNAFLGDHRVITLLPTGNSAASLHDQWAQTGGTGGSPFTAVNDNPNNGDTSYVSDSTPGDIESFVYGGLPSTVTTISAIQWVPIVRKDDVGLRAIAPFQRNGTTDSVGTTTTVTQTSTYDVLPMITENSLQTEVPWTTAEITAGELSLKIIS